MDYKATKYIADLQLDKIPADSDWKGVKSPLTVYDRIESTEEKYEYPNLIGYFDKISANGKKSLGAALFEWIVNRVANHFEGDVTIYYPIIEAYWASSIDIRYGGCNVSDLDYELIINHTERTGSDTNWVSSEWVAKGDIENILHTAIAFVANIESVNGSEEWLERLYYLALYLLPDELKPSFQKWFTTALERLASFTPARSITATYEDIFDEHWVENRGLPVPPQLLDPAFDYDPNQNTKLVDAFVKSCDPSTNRYLNDVEDMMENDFEGEPYTFSGVICKEKKSVDLKSLVSDKEDLSSMKTIPAAIKISSKEIDPTFEYDDYLYTDDRDGYVALENDKLDKILDKIEGKVGFGLALATSEWIVNILRDSTKTGKLELLLEAMWAKIDQNYMKPEAVDRCSYDEDEDDDICATEEDEDEDFEDEGDNLSIIHGLYEIISGLNNLCVECGIYSSNCLHIIVLARNLYKDESVFEAWIHNVVSRIMTDYPQSELNENEDDEGKDKSDAPTPVVSRDYYFNPHAIYKESVAKEELDAFINKLDFEKNKFLPLPEEVYQVSFVRGNINANPYNRDSKFDKEITAVQVAELGNKFDKVELSSYYTNIEKFLDISLAMKCYEKALEMDANCRVAYAYKGLHFHKAKLYEKSIIEFTRSIEMKPTSGTCYYMGESYYKLKEYDKAYDAYIKAIELKESLRSEGCIEKLSNHFANEAYKANETEGYELCVALATKSLALNPENMSGYLNRAAGYRNMKDNPEAYKKAEADVEKVRQLDPKGAAVTYSNEGLAFINSKEYDKAIEKANIALELDKKLAHGYFIRGYAYGEFKDFDRAIEDMSKAIELELNSELAFINRAYYYREQGRFAESIEDYNRTEAIVSDNYKVLLFDNKGKTYAMMGEFDKALENWLIAYNHSKKFTELIYAIFGYICIGDIDKAKEFLNKSLEMENDTSDGDSLVYSFIQYALQVNMESAISLCKELLNDGKTNVNYPLGQFIKVAIDNGHPDKETLIETAKKINKVDTL